MFLDINNNVPADMYDNDIKNNFPYEHKETFMGFRGGNTNAKMLSFKKMKNQLIMARSLPEEVTNGTLEGDLVLHSIACKVQQTASLEHILQRARFYR